MALHMPVASADRVIAALAMLQHGTVARRRLLALSIAPDEIRERLGAGRPIRLRRGLYAVGRTALTQKARWMAAVLAAGPAAVLSHRSAAAL